MSRLLGRSRPGLLVIPLVLSVLVAGCGAGQASGEGSLPGSSSSGSSASERTLTVLAAASLTEPFTVLADRFEAAHPGVEVTVSFGSSAALATQAVNGVPADVFASASMTTMDTVIDAGAARVPEEAAADPTAMVFAVNALEIAVPPDNPAAVTSVSDLDRPGVRLALCQPEAPCGAAAEVVARRNGLDWHPVTLESNVKATLAKVILGEVDAALVYRTDVRAAGDAVLGVEIPPESNATTDYPVLTLADSQNPSLAADFVTYVHSAEAADVLAEAGFAPAPRSAATAATGS